MLAWVPCPMPHGASFPFLANLLFGHLFLTNAAAWNAHPQHPNLKGVVQSVAAWAPGLDPNQGHDQWDPEEALEDQWGPEGGLEDQWGFEANFGEHGQPGGRNSHGTLSH